ncbi:hypothetical protein HPP92_001042 [Vanilla planifolia]|uniref:Uncharacterized protein n=1 Tax=Vanilla planifolia TaxID=51239 RepID=A0A835RXG0_VANPL|nr:hypothetical protein HPP92_001042 [Vanilla planifolia]
MGFTKDQLLDYLKELQTDFAAYEHPCCVDGSSTQAKYVGHLGGGLSKNLLLKVPPGCVTPLALINESFRSVSLLLDQGFKAQECCLFHPLSNEMTIALSTSNLDKFLMSIGRKSSYVDLEADLVVGKDNPPDLAAFVPVETVHLPEQTVKATSVHVSELQHMPLEKTSLACKEANILARGSKKVIEKPSRRVEVLAEATDVRKFINEIIDKTSAAVLSEISKDLKDTWREPPDAAILDGVKKNITSDLENLAMILKNAAYTQGFQAGIQSRSMR